MDVCSLFYLQDKRRTCMLLIVLSPLVLYVYVTGGTKLVDLSLIRDRLQPCDLAQDGGTVDSDQPITHKHNNAAMFTIPIENLCNGLVCCRTHTHTHRRCCCLGDVECFV